MVAGFVQEQKEQFLKSDPTIWKGLPCGKTGNQFFVIFSQSIFPGLFSTSTAGGASDRKPGENSKEKYNFLI